MLHRLHITSAIGLLILALAGCAPLKEPSGRDFHAAQAEITKQIIPQGKGRLVFYLNTTESRLAEVGLTLKLTKNRWFLRSVDKR